MKNLINTKSILFLGSLAGSCLLATFTLANPSMEPNHPGYPMKKSQSPVSGVSTANDPGRENFYGQKALDAATEEGNKEMKLRSRSSLLKEEMMEEKNEMEGKKQMKQNRNMGNSMQTK